MKKISLFLLVPALVLSFVLPCSAQEDLFAQIIKEGLLGAGAGALGGAASGAKGRDIWKGALAGAGINIVGSALLDSITRKNTVTTQARSYRAQPRYYTSASQPYTARSNQGVTQHSHPYYGGTRTYEDGYREGYLAGYKAGYIDGLRESK